MAYMYHKKEDVHLINDDHAVYLGPEATIVKEVRCQLRPSACAFCRRAIHRRAANSAPSPAHFAGDEIWAALLLDADLLDQAENVGFGHIVKLALVFFFQALTQKFRGDKARFAVGQVAAGALAEFHKRRVRQSQNDGVIVHEKLRVDGVRVARGDAIPHVRKPAVKYSTGQLGCHLKSANNGAHGAGVSKDWARSHA